MERFGWQPANGHKMMVEFVSANPTGPLHLGHARQAALGDAICTLYQTQGWEVLRAEPPDRDAIQVARARVDRPFELWRYQLVRR